MRPAICGGCGGIAYINVFDTVRHGGGAAATAMTQPAWVFPQMLGNSPKNIAEAVRHEVGHNFGLNHDGIATAAPLLQRPRRWAPIMGVGYDHPISQWSKGDYAGANNTQDDLTIIRGVTGARADEAGDTVGSAAPRVAGPCSDHLGDRHRHIPAGYLLRGRDGQRDRRCTQPEPRHQAGAAQLDRHGPADQRPDVGLREP